MKTQERRQRVRHTLITGTEQQHQEWLFDAIRLQERTYPDLALAFHCPNEGKHVPAYRAKQARQGVKAGVPDVLLPVPRAHRRQDGWYWFCGMALELKVGRNTPTTEQQRWLLLLSQSGWYTTTAYGWEAAWQEIEWYIQEEER